MLFRKKVDKEERQKAIDMIIEETEKQISELSKKLESVQSPEYRAQVKRYIGRLEDKKRRLQSGTYYK